MKKEFFSKIKSLFDSVLLKQKAMFRKVGDFAVIFVILLRNFF